MADDDNNGGSSGSSGSDSGNDSSSGADSSSSDGSSGGSYGPGGGYNEGGIGTDTGTPEGSFGKNDDGSGGFGVEAGGTKDDETVTEKLSRANLTMKAFGMAMGLLGIAVAPQVALGLTVVAGVAGYNISSLSGGDPGTVDDEQKSSTREGKKSSFEPPVDDTPVEPEVPEEEEEDEEDEAVQPVTPSSESEQAQKQFQQEKRQKVGWMSTRVAKTTDLDIFSNTLL